MKFYFRPILMGFIVLAGGAFLLPVAGTNRPNAHVETSAESFSPRSRTYEPLRGM
jgi:hypothetical protein